jgi:hypothetical protein
MRVVSFAPTSASGLTNETFAAISPRQGVWAVWSHTMTKPTMRVVTPRATAARSNPLHAISSLMGGWISTVAAGTNAWTGKFMASLHESRQQQARYTIDRYRYLVNSEADRDSTSKRH